MQVALNETVSLDVRPGRVFIVLGHPGAGKSNLTKLIMQRSEIDNYVVDPAAEYGDVKTRLTITDYKDMKSTINGLMARLSLAPKLILLVVEELPRLLLTTPRRKRADIKQLLITTVATARKNGFSTLFVSQLLDFIPDACLGLGSDFIFFRNTYRVNKMWGFVCGVYEEKKAFVEEVKSLANYDCIHIDLINKTIKRFRAEEYTGSLSAAIMECEKCGGPLGDPSSTWDMNDLKMGQFKCSECGHSFKAPINTNKDLIRTRSLNFDAKAILNKPWSNARKIRELRKRGLEVSMIADLLGTTTNSVSVTLSRARKKKKTR